MRPLGVRHVLGCTAISSCSNLKSFELETLGMYIKRSIFLFDRRMSQTYFFEVHFQKVLNFLDIMRLLVVKSILRFTLSQSIFWQNSVSPAIKSFLHVVCCSKLYQKFSWTLTTSFIMNGVFKKCVEKILRAETEASSRFWKSFFWQLKLSLGLFGVWFS